MVQLHTRGTGEQVKVLLKGDCPGLRERARCGDARDRQDPLLFALVTNYRNGPGAPSLSFEGHPIDWVVSCRGDGDRREAVAGEGCLRPPSERGWEGSATGALGTEPVPLPRVLPPERRSPAVPSWPSASADSASRRRWRWSASMTPSGGARGARRHHHRSADLRDRHHHGRAPAPACGEPRSPAVQGDPAR